MERAPITVVFLIGAGRSGSTLLARLLGALPAFVNIGEATAFVTGSLGRVRASEIPCGCGARLESCPFWSPILAGGADGDGAADPLLRMRGLPLLLSPLKSDRLQRRLDRLSVAARELVSAVAAAARAEVVVDSSKNPADAYILSRDPAIDLRLVHLVRDARGFVDSRARPKGYLARIPPLKATGVWMARNLSAELLRRHGRSYRRLRYEDLVADTRTALEDLASWITGAPVKADFFDGNRAAVGPQHMIGGNPDKLGSGQLEITRKEWQLPAAQRWLVTGLASPLLYRYGYPLRRVAT